MTLVLIGLTTVAGLASALALWGGVKGWVVALTFAVVIVALGTAAAVLEARRSDGPRLPITMPHFQVNGFNLTVNGVARSNDRAHIFLEIETLYEDIARDLFDIRGACALWEGDNYVALNPSENLIRESILPGNRAAGILTSRGPLPADFQGTLKCIGFRDLPIHVRDIFDFPGDLGGIS